MCARSCTATAAPTSRKLTAKQAHAASPIAPSWRPAGSQGDSGRGWIPVASRTSQAAPRLSVSWAVLNPDHSSARCRARHPISALNRPDVKLTSAATGIPQYSSAAKLNVSDASPKSWRVFAGVTIGRSHRARQWPAEEAGG